MISLVAKQAEHEADRSVPSCAKINNGGAIPLLSHRSSDIVLN
jgi:hypothetical protein